jgi:hypothetical protein
MAVIAKLAGAEAGVMDDLTTPDAVFDKLAELEKQLGRSAEIAVSIRSDIARDRHGWGSSRPAGASSPASSRPAALGGDERRRLTAELAERTREIATLTLLVADAERANAACIAERDSCATDFAWLQKVTIVLLNIPPWWGLMPKSLVDRLIRRRLAALGLFDRDRYLQRYSDVKADRGDPLMHYIAHGMAEGRER